MGKSISKAYNRLTSRRGSVQLEADSQMSAESDVLILKGQGDELRRYKTELESQKDFETFLIKQLIQTNRKDTAKLLIRKKMLGEFLLEEAERQLESIIQQCEGKIITFTQGVERGNEALKMIRIFLELNNVEKILEDNDESTQAEAEIERVLLLTSGGADGKLMDMMMDVDKEFGDMLALAGLEGKAQLSKEEEETLLILPEKVEIAEDPDARILEEIIAKVQPGAVLEPAEAPPAAKTTDGQEPSTTGASSEPSKEDPASAGKTWFLP